MALFPPYNGPPLMDQICAVENFTRAWQRVRSNIQAARRGRSAGTDAVTLADFERDWSRQMALLADDMRSGRYRPLPPRRIGIPKSSGGERAIAILAVRDRIAQRAVQQVLEPLFDPYFLDCSYGCRPRVGVPEAVARVARYAEQGLTWVVDADIADYFDSLDQRILLALVRQRVNEAPLLRLIALWLEIGACTTAETAPLPLSSHGVRALVERGRQAIQCALGDSAPAAYPDLYDPDPYAAARWERSVGWSLDGQEGRALPGMLYPTARSPIEALWTAFLLARPLLGGVRQVLPYVQRIGRERLLLAGTLTAGAVALTEGILRWQRAEQRGTPQGAALSPLLANIYLHPFDVALAAHGMRLVRYMDDFVVMCESETTANQAMILVERQLETLRLRLNREKTRVISYADGIDFLGQALAPRQRGPRLADGVASFEDAERRLRETAAQVRRAVRRRVLK